MNNTKSTSRLATITARSRTLRTVLIVPFVLQIFATVGLVGYLSFKNGQKAVNEIADRLMAEVGSRVEQNLGTYLTVPHQVNEINAAAIELGTLNLQDLPILQRHFWRQLQIFDTLTFTGLGLEQRDNLGAERIDNGSLTLRVSTAASNYDFRTYSTKESGEIDKLLNNKTNFDPRTAHSPVVQSCGSCWQTHLEPDLSQYGGDYCLSRRIYAFLRQTRKTARGAIN